MRIGFIAPVHGRPGAFLPAPTWESISEQASAAEAVGFDIFVFADALSWTSGGTTIGGWESMSIAAAVAATTSRIDIGQSVINSVYRSPAMTAKIADTIDEISGGRFVLGIGAGVSPVPDYEAFGFPIDKRYSRFAEAIQIIHDLLRNGEVDFDGEFYTARHAELVLRGPRREGIPITIAAGKPKMLQLVARYADAWNWWGWDETLEQLGERLGPIIEQLERACDAEDRDPSTLGRSFDLLTVVPEGVSTMGEKVEGNLEFEVLQPVTGTSEEIAEYILSVGELGFDEVRCDLFPKTVEAIEAMQPVVEVVHAG